MATVAIFYDANVAINLKNREFHKSEAPYILPNDTPEHQRLEEQSRRFRDLMGDRVFHAPTHSTVTRKALDIGCGTGIITDELARTHPDATVYGVDLSPIPVVRQKLPNIQYINADFIALSNPEFPETRFEKNTFDYTFSRLLILGISNWPQYVQRCASLVKSNGWVEIHEFDMMTYKVPKNFDYTSPSNTLRPQTFSLADIQSGVYQAQTDVFAHPAPWFNPLNKLCRAKGIDIRCGQHLAQHFEDAGLTDIKVTRYICPLGAWEGLTDAERRFAPLYRPFWGNIIPMLLKKLAGETEGVVDEAEIKKAVQSALERSADWDGKREFMAFYVVCGRKP